MSSEAQEIHAFFRALVAINMVFGKMTRNKAEKNAYKRLVDMYGEKHLEDLFKKEIEAQ